jgi:hypothetical protein
MRRSSRESITYEHRKALIHIEFYSNGIGGHEYHVPETVGGEDRSNLVRKIEEYCRKKRYGIVTKDL